MIDTEIANRIKEIRGDDRSQAVFGKLIDRSQTAVKNFEKGQIPRMEVARRIAAQDPKKRGVEWLLTGKQTDLGGAALSTESAAVYEVLKITDRHQRIPETEDVEIKLVKVPILEDRIAAGPGRTLDFGKIEDWARVPRWKLKRGNSYYMLRVTGDSMEPQLHAGDLILVNLTRRDPIRLKEKLVAAWLGEIDGATIKLLQEDENGRFWVLRPRNRIYKDIVIAKDNEEFQVAAVEAAWLNFE